MALTMLSLLLMNHSQFLQGAWTGILYQEDKIQTVCVCVHMLSREEMLAVFKQISNRHSTTVFIWCSLSVCMRVCECVCENAHLTNLSVIHGWTFQQFAKGVAQDTNNSSLFCLLLNRSLMAVRYEETHIQMPLQTATPVCGCGSPHAKPDVCSRGL